MKSRSTCCNWKMTQATGDCHYEACPVKDFHGEQKPVVLLRHHQFTIHIWINYKEIATATGVKTKTIFPLEEEHIEVSLASLRKRKPILSMKQDMINPMVLSPSHHQAVDPPSNACAGCLKFPSVQVIHKHGVSYRRPFYYYIKKPTMELRGRQPNLPVVWQPLIYIDGSTNSLWNPTGEQTPPMPNNRGYSVTCIAGKVHFYILPGSNNAERFLYFLTGLSWQKGVTRQLRRRGFLQEAPNLTVFLPLYSYPINLIGRIWLNGKWRKCLLEQATEVFCQQAKASIDQLEAQMVRRSRNLRPLITQPQPKVRFFSHENTNTHRNRGSSIAESPFMMPGGTSYS